MYELEQKSSSERSKVLLRTHFRGPTNARSYASVSLGTGSAPAWHTLVSDSTSFIGTMLITFLSQIIMANSLLFTNYQTSNHRLLLPISKLSSRNMVFQARWFPAMSHSIPHLPFKNLVMRLVLLTLDQVLCTLNLILLVKEQSRRWNDCCRRNASNLTLILT
jgi:hypothetical protein